MEPAEERPPGPFATAGVVLRRSFSTFGDARGLEALWTRTARESRYLDVLFDELEAQGYALLPGSETRESLEAYRATPRPEWLD